MISQFADIFVQMVVLFAVGATGYAAKRLNLMDEDFDKKFSKLILNTALPALILASVLTAETLPSATKILWTAGVSWCSSQSDSPSRPRCACPTDAKESSGS